MESFICAVFMLLLAFSPVLIILLFIYNRKTEKKSADLVTTDVRFLSRGADAQSLAGSVAQEVSRVPDNVGAKVKIVSANELGVVISQGNSVFHWWEIRLDFTAHDPVQGHLYLHNAESGIGDVVRGMPKAREVLQAVLKGLKQADPNISLSGS